MTVEKLVRICVDTCNMTLRKKSLKGKRRPVYWWNEELTRLRKDCSKARRQVTQGNRLNLDLHDRETRLVTYRENKNNLKKTIFEAKNRAWKEVCEEVDIDIWGLGYRIVMGKIRPVTSKPSDEEQIKIAKELFPMGDPGYDLQIEEYGEQERNECIPFSEEDLQTVVKGIKTGKAPGPDIIPPDLVKIIAQRYPKEVLQAINSQLMAGKFPDSWKVARLVLIENKRGLDGEKEVQTIMYDRCFGKLFEHLIARRLLSEIGEDGLGDNQYGFRKGRSTIDALQQVINTVDNIKQKAYQYRDLCLLILLDIKNTFNSASCKGIKEELMRRRLPRYLQRIITDYLSNRKILVGEIDCLEPAAFHKGLFLSHICGIFSMMVS
ncbi:hypothetical protein J6590_108393 [Homalodisca vitripennis]|nr:hypothetical protein J6590_108393 [Homalodisca vitripennis]